MTEFVLDLLLLVRFGVETWFLKVWNVMILIMS